MANVCVVDPPYSITRYYDYYDVQEDALKTTQVKSPSVFKSLDLYVDAVARPGITGLGVYCFLRKNSRFSNKIRLHRWSRWTTLFMALCVADQSVAFLVERLDNINNPTPHETVDSGFMKLASTSWVFVCNALQVYITNLKLQVLGLRLTAWICQALLLLSLGTGAYEILSYFKIFDSPWTTFLSFAINVGGVLLVQCIALCSAATRALLYREGGESIRCFAFFLYVNGVLAIAGPLLSYISVVAMWANFLSRDVDLFDGLIVVPQLPMLVVTLDNGLQVLGTLLLTGMLGPKGWERPMEAFRLLAHLSGFGLASKRIAFPGKINAQATKCIASFPGKYSAEWLWFALSISDFVCIGVVAEWMLGYFWYGDVCSGASQIVRESKVGPSCLKHSGGADLLAGMCVLDRESFRLRRPRGQPRYTWALLVPDDLWQVAGGDVSQRGGHGRQQ